MDLSNNDNRRLARNACIVRIIEYELKLASAKDPEKIKYFQACINDFTNLKQCLMPGKSIEKLEEYKKAYIPTTKKFLEVMESSNRFAIAHEYYARAKKAAERIYGSKKINSKLIKQFFTENKISDLRAITLGNRFKFIGGATITALIAAGALYCAHSNNTPAHDEPTRIESLGQEIEDLSHISDTLEELSQDSSNSINLDTESKDFYQHLVDDFKTRYLEEYNKENNTNLTTDDIVLRSSSQNYVYLVNINGEARYLSHGDYPYNTESFLKKNNLEYEIIREISSYTIYKRNPITKEINQTVDEFGNKVNEKLDSVVGFSVKFYDGNNPSEILSTVESKSILSKLSAPLQAIYKPGTNKEKLNNYNKALESMSGEKASSNRSEIDIEPDL